MYSFLQAHPNLKYIFFGGKGGVGKTVIAGATALWLAKIGKSTLLASTNPVHSLSGLLEQNVFGGATQIAPNFYALEIDTKETIKKFQTEIRDKLKWFLKFADIPVKADDFVQTATINPAFEESAMFENMIDLIFRDEYEIFVFDTAPTANARRLLGMSKIYSLWVNKMLQSREEASSLKAALSFKKQKTEKDPIFDYLLNFQDRLTKAEKLLTDAELTSFFFVTLPEALPIAVIKRFINWFQDFGIPIGGVIVNGLIKIDESKENLPLFVLNRIQMQKEYLQQIHQTFANVNVRAEIPLFEHEVKGTDMLSKVSQALFAEKSRFKDFP